MTLSSKPEIPLRCHPASPCDPAGHIDASLDRNADGSLIIAFRAFFPKGTLCFPEPQPAGPADGLWQHTCCEAFLAESGTAYRELNFSPSGQWACYRFTDYRARDEAYIADGEPMIRFIALADGFELLAKLPASLLPPGGPRAIGLSAVIEASGNNKSYWALTHVGEQPDFHCRESFTLPDYRPTP